MKHLDEFPIFGSFSMQDYEDFLFAEFERDPDYIDKSDNWLYCFYYDNKWVYGDFLENGTRFKDIKAIYDDIYPSSIILVKKDYYDKNRRWLVENIVWKKHELAELQLPNNIKMPSTLKRFFKWKRDINLPSDISIIKTDEVIEFWPQKETDSPIVVSEDVYFQYLIYKYICDKIK